MDQSETRALVTRVPAETKRSFKMALLRHHITVQATLAAFMDVFIDQDLKPSPIIRQIIDRALVLQRKEG
jgi:predicted RNase H-related nuclease YkuK (DUF458 family)